MISVNLDLFVLKVFPKKSMTETTSGLCFCA
jgi:hypothetical protein